MRFLEGALPDQGQVKVLKVAYKTLKGINRRWPHKCFAETLEAEHAEHMRARDEAFFLSHGFKVPLFTDFVDEMKQIWVRTDAEFKDRIWDHLGELLDLSQQCRAGCRQLDNGGGGDEDFAQYVRA